MSNAQVALVKDQLDLLAWHGSRPQEAFGETYNPAKDGLRVNAQMWAVWFAMRRGDWVTLPQLRQCCPGLDSSISARTRELRKWLEETGRGTVKSERMSDGLWRYRIVREWPLAGRDYR